MQAVKKEVAGLKNSSRVDVDGEDSHPSSPRDNATAAYNNFDETGTIPSGASTTNGKALHRNNIDNKLVTADWV